MTDPEHWSPRTEAMKRRNKRRELQQRLCEFAFSTVAIFCVACLAYSMWVLITIGCEL